MMHDVYKSGSGRRTTSAGRIEPQLGLRAVIVDRDVCPARWSDGIS